MAWRIDQVDVDILPVEGDAGGVNGDAALLFFLVKVSLGRSLIDHSNAVSGSAAVEHSLGDGRLAGIDMGDDADVS